MSEERVKEKSTVLIVEASSAQRRILGQKLIAAGYEVTEASSAKEAQQRMLALGPAVVLLAWELRDAEGPELLRRWKSDADLQWIPVLMLTSHRDPEKIYHALECGAIDYLHKPPDDLELRARIQSALRIRSLQDELRRLASRDSLTGLLNRRVFMTRLRLDLARSRRYARELSLGILDIDHFKAINDEHGHDIGDLVLTQFSAYLSRSIREVDMLARYGGEEFVLLLPETPIEPARAVLDRLRDGTVRETWGNDSHAIELTFSAGVSCFVAARATDPEALIKLADVALYRAKQTGRNRVEVAQT